MILRFKYGKYSKYREMLTLLFLTILRLNYLFYFRLLHNFNMFTVAKKNKVKVRNFSRVNSQETANTYASFLHQPLPEQGF